MFGFILAFGTAIFEASKDIASKYNLHYIDEYATAFSMHLVQSGLLVPLLFFLGFPSMSVRFLLVLGISSVLQLGVILLYFKAIKRSELSTTVPLITLTPLFMLLTSPFIIGQFPSTMGVVAIVLIVAGTYISNIGDNPRKIFAPLCHC